MRYLYILLAISLVTATGCKKDNKQDERFTVTIVAENKFAGTTTYAARVENANPDRQPFLCKIITDIGRPTYNCTDAIYIKNLPARLAVIGKTIRFSRYKDYGQNMLLSSIHHAHELDVYDPVEVHR